MHSASVSVRMSPESSMRVTRVVAVLESWASIVVEPGIDSPDVTDTKQVLMYS